VHQRQLSENYNTAQLGLMNGRNRPKPPKWVNYLMAALFDIADMMPTLIMVDDQQ